MLSMLERTSSKAYGGIQSEWYTPRFVIDKVREVLGKIDLDPASCPEANKVVRAKSIFTEENSGLAKDLHGRIFLNPPYQTKLIKVFVSHLLHQLQLGNTKEAIILTHNCTDSRWFHDLASSSAAICLVKGRVKFWRPCLTKSTPARGQALCYFGDRADKFAKVFSTVGTVCVPLRLAA
jgi:ParB family transcriptional regulator, chromosome partitioning protein